MEVTDQLQASVHIFLGGGEGGQRTWFHLSWRLGETQGRSEYLEKRKIHAGGQYQFHGRPAPNLVAIPVDLANDYGVHSFQE